MGEFPALFRNSPILLGLNDQDAHSRFRSRDILIKTGALISFFIQSDAEKFQSEASRGPDLSGVLAHSGCKHQCIHSAQNRGHPTNRHSETMHIDIECQLRSLVTLVDGREDLAHIARETGDTEQPRLLIQDVVDSLSVQMTLAHKVSQNSWIH